MNSYYVEYSTETMPFQKSTFTNIDSRNEFIEMVIALTKWKLFGFGRVGI